jgi:hypothetical protein
LLLCLGFAKFYRVDRIRIDDLLVFTKRGQLRDQIARSVYGDRISIEDELIVPTNRIAIADRPLIGARLRRDHLEPTCRRPKAKWGRAQVQNDLCPLLHQTAHRFDVVKRSRQIIVRPNIFTDGDTNFFAIELERLDATGRFEIAVLVENVVSRQKAFVRHANRFATFE